MVQSPLATDYPNRFATLKEGAKAPCRYIFFFHTPLWNVENFSVENRVSEFVITAPVEKF